MPARTSHSPVLNGWRSFSSSNHPYGEELLHWAYQAETRQISTILFEPMSALWVDPVDHSPINPADVDFYLPLSAFSPPSPDRQVFRNPAPVVVMLVMSNRGLIVIRRAIPDGFGKLGLPGGFHNMGETWQQAGSREVFEETGVLINPDMIRIYDVVTVENGSINLIFGIHDGVVTDPVFTHDEEIMDVIECTDPVETAFPSHTEIITRYLASIGKDTDDILITER